jgi:hypothetical protein
MQQLSRQTPKLYKDELQKKEKEASKKFRELMKNLKFRPIFKKMLPFCYPSGFFRVYKGLEIPFY